MRKHYLILLFVSAFLVSLINGSKKEKREYNDRDIKCSYRTTKGRFDGYYISFYRNGKKKSEGSFENNLRSGKWSVWDSTGRLRMQREYKNPFVVNRIFPKIHNEKPIQLLNVPPYNLKYNKDGYLENFPLRERMIVWSKRLWRSLIPEENEILFENNRLFRFLNKNILNKNITAYSVADDQFTKELTSGELDTSSTKIIGFKIKEDFFFDNERLVSESRIIGICPVVVRKGRPDTIDLYWVYYPEIRKYFAQEKIPSKGIPSKIKSMDDLFFFRYFHGQIYKESNVYDRNISDYKKGKEIEKEAERIEISLIEQEHDIWISLTE